MNKPSASHTDGSASTRSRSRGQPRWRCCDQCGQGEWVRRDNRSTTCKSCSARINGLKVNWAEHRKGEVMPCQFCGKQFYRYPSDDTKFCGLGCWRQSRRVERNCKACGTNFFVTPSILSGKTNASGNFCSRSCYDSWLCKPDRVTGRGSRWKRIRRFVLEKQHFCAMCGTRKSLQVHHIVPFRLTQDNRFKNLIPLCTGCHKKIEWVTCEIEMLAVGLDVLFSALSLALRGRQRATAQMLKRLHVRTKN